MKFLTHILVNYTSFPTVRRYYFSNCVEMVECKTIFSPPPWAIPTWCMPESLTRGFLWSLWRGKRSRYAQFYASGKRPMEALTDTIRGGQYPVTPTSSNNACMMSTVSHSHQKLSIYKMFQLKGDTYTQCCIINWISRKTMSLSGTRLTKIVLTEMHFYSHCTMDRYQSDGNTSFT